MTETKKCKSCGIEKQKTKENFRLRGKWFSGKCRVCLSEEWRKFADENPEKVKEINRLSRAKRKDKIKAYRRKYHLENRDERLEKWRKWANENPEKVRECNRRTKEKTPIEKKRKWQWNKIFKNTGWTPELWDSRWSEQEGSCPGCGRAMEKIKADQRGPKGTTAVRDHCHTVKAPRGLLCSNCNCAIGQACDDPERLRALADYVEQWRVVHALQILLPLWLAARVLNSAAASANPSPAHRNARGQSDPTGELLPLPAGASSGCHTAA